ncbi:MAG: hypothetical protein H0T73_14970 [Ardenticatenales bacterium]|nr:hypothetical protein [Ardenticatenales bacterium]
MGYRTLVVLMGVGLLVCGCAGSSGGGETETRPADFQLEYNWQAGSLPPPYHYEYTISIGPDAQGEIVFQPDYPSDKTPVWREPLTVTEANLDAIYALAREKGLFSETWQEATDAPVGGRVEWLEVTANGQQISLPAFMEQNAQTIASQELYEAIRDLVPEATWEKLETQRAQYEQEFLAGEE